MFKFKNIILLISLVTSIFASNIIEPNRNFQADGAVIDIVYNDNKLYVSTDVSAINIFSLNSYKKIETITIPKIKDFMGDIIDSKIYSIDIINNNILILSEGEHGFRKLDIYKNGKLIHIFGIKDKLYIAKAKFLDNKTVVLGLLSNDIISYNIETKTQNWTVQASGSKFSNFALSEDKTEVVICDESGDTKIINTLNGKIKKNLTGQNLDNVFQVDYKNGIIITAGQDRRAVVYNLKHNSSYYKTTKFLIYSAGLSPSGKIAGYASDENNNVTLFKTDTKSNIGIFGGNKMTINNILFLNEKEFIISTDDKVINYYKLK